MNNREMKKVTRLIKKGIKENENKFHPNCVSIKGICDEINHPEYLNQIGNRIIREHDDTSSIWEHIYVGLDLAKDIQLDAEGLKLCSDILSSYFDSNKIADLYDYMLKKDSLEYEIYKARLGLKSASTSDLKQAIQLYQDVKDEYPDLTVSADVLIAMINDELKSRKFTIKKGDEIYSR